MPKRSPKYRQIADELLREIRTTMARGTKLPSASDLARRFGVHLLTMREALRVLQEGGVIERKRAVGTRVINPMGGKWVTILCEMDLFSPVSNSLFARSVIHHLRQFLEEEGLFARVSIGCSRPSDDSGGMTSQDFVADLENNRLAGVLALATTPSEWWMAKLRKQGTPLLGSNELYPHHVLFDPWADLAKALRCLTDHGRSRIGYVGWVERQEGHPVNTRLASALDGLERCYPVKIERAWIKSEIHPLKEGAGWEEFRELWMSDRQKPDGLIVDNENLLPDIERAIGELGVSVPRDLMIVCHRTRGNDRVPRFPTIFLEADPHLYAFRMFEAFMRLYRGEPPAESAAVPRFLVEDEFRRTADAPSTAPRAETF